MRLGKVKPTELFACLIVILILLALGYWVSVMSPMPKKKTAETIRFNSNQAQQVVDQPASQKQEFVQLGESGTAIKLPTGYTISQNENGNLTITSESINLPGITVQQLSLADITRIEQECENQPCSPSSWTRDEYFAIKNAYEKGEDLEGAIKATYAKRDFFLQTALAGGDDAQVEMVSTLDGETLMVFSYMTDPYDGEISSEFIEMMESLQITSQSFSRSGLMEVYKRLFAKEYLVSHQSVTIDQLWATQQHARGEVTIQRTDSTDSGIFFAVKKNNEWMLVFDGNGAYSCQDLQTEAFPLEMQEGCVE